MPDTFYAITARMIVTAEHDETAPTSDKMIVRRNARVLATIGGHDDFAETKAMLHRANTQPVLLAALKALQPHFAGECAYDHPDCVQLRAALAAAKGE